MNNKTLKIVIILAVLAIVITVASLVFVKNTDKIPSSSNANSSAGNPGLNE